MTAPPSPGIAVHVCADLSSPARTRPMPAVRSGRDSLTRLRRLCTTVGIVDQRAMVSESATVDRFRRCLAIAAEDIEPGGLLVLTFMGHSVRDGASSRRSDRRYPHQRGRPLIRWSLYDGDIRLSEVAQMFGRLGPGVRVIVVADTCYAGALAHHVDAARDLVLLGACADDQTSTNGATSDFVVRLVDLVGSGGTQGQEKVSYRLLANRLRLETPDAERPFVWVNPGETWRERPFAARPSLKQSTTDQEAMTT